MNNIKFFDGQVVESDDLNNLQQFTEDDIRSTRLDLRTSGVMLAESQSPLVFAQKVQEGQTSISKLGIFGMVVYTPEGERIEVPANDDSSLPAVSGLLPDSTGKLVEHDGHPLANQTGYTMVIRHATLMAPPMRHHVTTGKTQLITEKDTYELWLRTKGGKIAGDVVLCDFDVDTDNNVTFDFSKTEYSYINAEDVIAPLEADIQVGENSSYSGTVSFSQHVNAVGTGPVTEKNPHGMSPADLGIDIGALADHQTLLHSDGIRTDNVLSTTSAMYPYFIRESAVTGMYDVVIVCPLATSLREMAVINGQSALPSDFSTTFEYSFDGKADPAYVGYYLVSYDINKKAVVVNGPYTSETATGFVSLLNTATLFPICSFQFASVTYDVTGDGVPDVVGNYDIIPGSFKDRRKFHNTSLNNFRPDEVFAVSQFAPYMNDRAYLHNARVIGMLNNPTYYLSGKQLKIVVDNDDDNPIVVTFTGANPFDTETILTQIRKAATTVDSDGYTYLRVYPRITDDGYLSLSAPLAISVEPLESNDASGLLGFDTAYDNLYNQSDIIKELIYVGERNGIVLFEYDENDNVSYIEYLLGGGIRRFNTFTYNGELITSVREGVEPL